MSPTFVALMRAQGGDEFEVYVNPALVRFIEPSGLSGNACFVHFDAVPGGEPDAVIGIRGTAYDTMLKLRGK